jgi:hypothetical protein
MVRTPKYCTFRKDMQEERSYMQGYEALAEKNTREFLEEAAPASLESIKKLVTRR